MDRRIFHATLALDEIGHAPGGPEAGAISQSVRASLQALHDALPVRVAELARPARPRRALQGFRATLLQLPRPAVHRLAMHPDPPRHLGLRQALLEQTRRLQASPLELHSIPFHSGWMSHAEEYTGNSYSCHYIM